MVIKVVRWTAGTVLAALVAVMLGVLLLPRAFGLAPYVVTSGSMRPTFDPGAVVLAKAVPTAQLETGDVVTFQTPDDLTTHRIVAVKNVVTDGETRTLLTTQGDANNAADAEPVDARNVRGEVRYAVPGLGYLVALLRTPAGLAGLAGLFLVAAITGRKPQPAEEMAPELAGAAS